MGFYGNILLEKVSIVPPTTKYGNYTTNKKFKGVTVEVFVGSNQDSSEDGINKIANNLEKDIKVLNKNYNKAVKPIFEKRFLECDSWEMKCDSVSDLMKMAKLSNILYYCYPGSTRKNYFELYFNGGNDFFGGHSLVIELYISGDNIVTPKSSIEG